MGTVKSANPGRELHQALLLPVEKESRRRVAVAFHIVLARKFVIAFEPPERKAGSAKNAEHLEGIRRGCKTPGDNEAPRQCSKPSHQILVDLRMHHDIRHVVAR